MSSADFRQRLSTPSEPAIETAWRLAQQQPEQALQLLADLLNRDQTNIDAWLVAANILQNYGEFAQAADAYRRVIAIAPDHSAALHNLARMLIATGALAEAESLINQILSRESKSADAWALLAALRQKQVRDAEAMDALHRSLAIQPNPIHHSNLLQIMQYMDNVTLQALLAAHQQWSATYNPQSAIRNSQSFTPSLSPSVPPSLRLAFLSADFGRHPTGWLTLRAIECLDRSQCSVVCYYDRLPEDDFTARFRNASDAWHVTAHWSDEQLADQIRADQIDVLFDLMGHTGNRLLMFARHPAPVQITWLGYVGTTGLSTMDYLLADRFLVPAGEEPLYTERILRMPHAYVCFGPPDDAPDVSPLPALSSGRATFGCFNNAFKLSPTILDAWAQILLRVPDSQLLLKNRSLSQPEFRDRLHAHFAQHGIPPQRVLLEGGAPHSELLAAYSRIDLALDTQPFSGCLTTCEALWMGVPTITFAGKTFAGRQSVSHLAAAGYPQFIAADMPGYIELAVDWAGRLNELAALRSQMRSQVVRSPLCNAPQFATDLLALLQQARPLTSDPGVFHAPGHHSPRR
jgi:predicted O-linked N-acetylglucosamine transferase (SPINDLY family)